MAVYDFSGSFRNLNNSISGLGQTFEDQRKREASQAAINAAASGDYTGAAKAFSALGDVGSSLKLMEIGQARSDRQAGDAAAAQYLGGGGAPSLGGIGAPQAAAGGGAQTLANLGSANQVETRFMGAAREAGLQNPFGLAALAATGKRESGWSPSKANASWSDPSQRGQPGTSGGILSWRNERLRGLHSFAQQRGEQVGAITPETQALYAFNEDPTLVHRLNAAKTPEEANRVMAQAWKYAGYDGSGPEYQARLNATRQYMARYNGQGGQQTQVAQSAQQGPSTADRAQMAIQRVDMLLNDPEISPQQRAALTQRRQQYAQAAQADPQEQGDLPAEGSVAAEGYAIPGRPGHGGMTSQQAQAQIRFYEQGLANRNLPEGARKVLEGRIQRLIPYADPARALDVRSKELSIQKQERDLEAEGATPLTPDERQQFGIRPDMPAYKNRRGEIKFGPAGTTINNNMPDRKGETKFAETLGAKQAERWNNYITEGDVAQTRMSDIQTLREASRRLGSQGSSANFKSLIGPYAESLNIKIDGLPDIQLYESITNRLAPQLRAPGSGSTSDIEFKGFMRAIGPLSNTPAAREMILDTFEAASRNDLARSEIATRLATGEISRGQAEKELRSMPSPMEAYRAFKKANPDVVGEAIKASARQEAEDKKTGAKQTPTPGSVTVPPPAVNALRSDPNLRAQFDAKYGQGMADRVLKGQGQAGP